MMRAAAIAVFFALAHAGPATAQGTLRGTVTLAGSGIAIAGAQVSLAGLNIGTITGADGTYQVEPIPAGIHEVVVVLIGYETERRQVTIADGQPTTLNVVLTETVLEVEGVVAVGSRARPRTVTESPVPVDVIPAAEILQQGRHRLRQPAAQRGSVVQRQYSAHQRCGHLRAAREPPRPGPGPHPRPGQRETAPSRGGHHLVRQRPLRRLAGP
ncbi:MAG: carboxypeptidase-like regulatory domain-containing protein [Gammaproteobacteria bacterium]|nr:carboxypeptidase-like regulatory domain-containing protein [Gammaproteobacteria bacterium]